MNGRALSAIVVALSLAAPATFAHHLITEVYDVRQATTIEGSIDGIVLKNPHTFVHLSVAGAGGTRRTWAIELEGATKLRQQGIGRQTFEIGDRLRVCGNPGRDASQYRLLMLELRRPADGFAISRHVEESEAACPP